MKVKLEDGRIIDSSTIVAYESLLMFIAKLEFLSEEDLSFLAERLEKEVLYVGSHYRKDSELEHYKNLVGEAVNMIRFQIKNN